ncbi:MAG: hypothetical protein ACHBN1_18685 [Heteroscytonema crispum UTEX LB 1556]
MLLTVLHSQHKNLKHQSADDKLSLNPPIDINNPMGEILTTIAPINPNRN